MLRGELLFTHFAPRGCRRLNINERQGWSTQKKIEHQQENDDFGELTGCLLLYRDNPSCFSKRLWGTPRKTPPTSGVARLNERVSDFDSKQ